MGTRLRNLVKNTKGLGGRGKLTGKLIDELTIYYGLAIRRNAKSADDMKKSIWGTLYHKISTDKTPQHQFCPVGEDSWCSYQRAKATNDLKKYKHKPPLSSQVFEAIKPVYEDLSREELLERCVGGYTQNSNESFNVTVWDLAPKSQSSGKVILDIATDIAVCTFNDGFKSILKIMEVLNLNVSSNCYDVCQEADARRVKSAEGRLSDAAKNARKSITSTRKEQKEAEETLEGILYGAEIAD